MEELELLNKIEKLVKKYLYPNCYDIEDIAVKIWIELFLNKKYVSNLYVKNRCIDEIRRSKFIKFVPVEEFENTFSKNENEEDPKELVNLLMANTLLTNEEKRIVYEFFYKGEKVPSFILDKVLEKLKNELNIILKAKGDLE